MSSTLLPLQLVPSPVFIPRYLSLHVCFEGKENHSVMCKGHSQLSVDFKMVAAGGNEIKD
jgi:hypothetical protein